VPPHAGANQNALGTSLPPSSSFSRAVSPLGQLQNRNAPCSPLNAVFNPSGQRGAQSTCGSFGYRVTLRSKSVIVILERQSSRPGSDAVFDGTLPDVTVEVSACVVEKSVHGLTAVVACDVGVEVLPDAHGAAASATHSARVGRGARARPCLCRVAHEAAMTKAMAQTAGDYAFVTNEQLRLVPRHGRRSGFVAPSDSAPACPDPCREVRTRAATAARAPPPTGRAS
jgi:hypothetical protein